MPVSKVHVVANCDMATIVWLAQPVVGCRGFALDRQVSGAEGDSTDDFVRTWVGFVGQPHALGESRPSTTWPIQRYIWSDYLVSQGQKVRYRVIPMLGPAANLTKAGQNEWSAWTDWIVIGTGQSTGFNAYFNRGIVPAQFLAEQANSFTEFHKMLAADIKNPKAKNRIFLSGPLRIAILALLEKVARDGVTLYAALYELNDPELIAALKAIGANCNLILGSGAYKPAKGKTPAEPDENAAVRKDLKSTSKIHISDRLVKSPHFAHNKFLIICDKTGKPTSVWTGSMNWTVTGLCTQVNNGILIESPAIAQAYKKRWDELKLAGSLYPSNIAVDGSTPGQDTLNRAPITAWNVPCLKYVDLADARKHITNAKEGVLFLMFNPGFGDGKKKAFSLLQDIQALDKTKLFVHGVVNQEQKNGKSATIQLTHRGTTLPPVNQSELTPKALTDATKHWFHQEFMFNMVMIHSKVIVVDPFGANPIVMTGSHNMGPKASLSNDDNLAIIENVPGLASEYAVNIMGVYGHYKWLYNAYLRAKAKTDPNAKKKAVAISPQYDGNQDGDQWQQWYQGGANLQEILFWVGQTPPLLKVPGAAPSPATPGPPVPIRKHRKVAKVKKTKRSALRTKRKRKSKK